MIDQSTAIKLTDALKHITKIYDHPVKPVKHIKINDLDAAKVISQLIKTASNNSSGAITGESYDGNAKKYWIIEL